MPFFSGFMSTLGIAKKKMPKYLFFLFFRPLSLFLNIFYYKKVFKHFIFLEVGNYLLNTTKKKELLEGNDD